MPRGPVRSYRPSSAIQRPRREPVPPYSLPREIHKYNMADQLSPLALFVASKIIRYAGNIRSAHEEVLKCPDCKLLPARPVTGRCGHSRCTMCIKKNGACPCGTMQPSSLHINILARDIIDKIMSNPSLARLKEPTHNAYASTSSLSSNEHEISCTPSTNARNEIGGVRGVAPRSPIRQHQSSQTWGKDNWLRQIMAFPIIRLGYANMLRGAGRYREAALHLALVAAIGGPKASAARKLLPQVISALSQRRDPRRLIPSLYKSIREQSIKAVIDPSSVECPVCFDVLEHPVTTTCGHTFCRHCINRTMETRHVCPLCSSSLTDFCLAQTDDTKFICAVRSIIVPRSANDPNLIPIFSCTVAFPNIPCPMVLFDSEFQVAVTRALGSGSRRFGMIATLGHDVHANYGTVVEIRDCVVLEDGRSILSTVGISRFRVLEKIILNGCPYARILEHVDIIPEAPVPILTLQLLAQTIKIKVQRWLLSLHSTLRTDIATCFGPFPEMDLEEEWWDSPNGPVWLWWLIAILPLKTDIQLLMLSSRHLTKRVTAVLRTLDAIEYYSYAEGYTMQ